MSGVPVIVAPPTEVGRLHPKYVNGTGIFTLRSSLPRLWPYGVNIDGMLILDFDENRVLAGVELIAPMSMWKGRGATAKPPGSPGDIKLPEGGPNIQSYSWPVVVSKDMQRDEARISFGSGGFNRVVVLSKTASALLEDDCLTGFWFSFAR